MSCNRIINEDIQLFQELIKPNYEHLYKFIYCIVHNKSLTDDIFQTTLLKGYIHLNDLINPTSFKSWIFSIAKNESFNAFKKNSREVCVDILECDNIPANDNCFPEEYLIKNETKFAIIEAINSLDIQDREIIILRYYNNYKFEEISDILNINHNTIRTRHKVIKNKLFTYLKKNKII